MKRTEPTEYLSPVIGDHSRRHNVTVTPVNPQGFDSGPCCVLRGVRVTKGSLTHNGEHQIEACSKLSDFFPQLFYFIPLPYIKTS